MYAPGRIGSRSATASGPPWRCNRTICARPANSATDVLCSNPLAALQQRQTRSIDRGRASPTSTPTRTATARRPTDVEYSLQNSRIRPQIVHFVGMTFQPEGFVDMKDKYFLLNGRSYPDTVTAGAMQTDRPTPTGNFSQPIGFDHQHSGRRKSAAAHFRPDVMEYQTLASLGIPMKVVGYNAKLLRDQAGINMAYTPTRSRWLAASRWT